jgi:conjugal transfer pilus assembly protein TraV
VRALHGTSPAVAAAALRSEPRVLRLWVKPWEDTDGDLVDQSYVHVQIDNGRWLTEHVHRRTREAYAAVKPPPNLGLAKDSKDGTARPALPAPVSRAGTFPGAGPVQQED